MIGGRLHLIVLLGRGVQDDGAEVLESLELRLLHLIDDCALFFDLRAKLGHFGFELLNLLRRDFATVKATLCWRTIRATASLGIAKEICAAAGAIPQLRAA